MECARDCGCGSACENQRFLGKRYAKVSVIKTEKKGYGLRADTDLEANDFIFEYIGEVIGEAAFRRRMVNYDEEGIKHFYFMSLTKGEFVDATKRGNLGRFCNHSCNPNSYVDKWVVGDKLRMGIFAERRIKAGEELVFNYNVDRYGADPQPCYCGEPNCTGFIGGKTQTERATKLSKATIEALGIDDADSWDTAVAKKPRKKKVSEDDEEYVNNVEPRELDEGGVRSVMAQLPQTKEKWIAVKLLDRIQKADDSHVINQVVRMHGYRHLKTTLGNFADDVNLCLQILDVLDKLPRITRNKVQDSKIEDAVRPLTENEDERVASRARDLLEAWSKLEIGYRIPRVKRDPNAVLERKAERADRREDARRRSRSRSRERSKSPERVHAPKGPKSNVPGRNAFRPPPRFRPPPPGPLPAGWFEAVAPNGSKYYYDSNGTRSWQRPTQPAHGAPPPPPPKAVSDQQMLQDLIKNIVANKQESNKPSSETATPAETPKKERKEEKWKSLPEEKQKKLYETAIQPHVMHVASKFKKKMEKDDLKRLAKDVSKKIVNTDFKNKRVVGDPSKISDKHAKSVKKYVHETFEKAIKKRAEHDKKKAEKQARGDESNTPQGSPQAGGGSLIKDDDDPVLSDDEDVGGAEATPESSSALKRMREVDVLNEAADDAVLKRLRTNDGISPAPPPPPPPPPAEPEPESMDTDPSPSEYQQDTPDNHASGMHATSGAEHDAFGNGHDAGFSIRGASSRPGSSQKNYPIDTLQTATPPTTGSPDTEDPEKAARRQAYSGMSADRMRQLGLFDGAAE
jgi:SET domain-containing protein